MPGALTITLGQWMKRTGILGGSPRPDLTALGPLGPAPALQHPMLLVPALGLPAREYLEIANHYASNPANGAPGRLVDGSRSVVDLNTGLPARPTRLFALEYLDRNVGSTRKLDQLSAAVDRVAALTGDRVLTFVTHSAGVHDVRLFLQRMGDRFPDHVFHVVALGQGRNGLLIGELGRRLSRAHYTEAARSSPLIAELNDTWQEQVQRTRSFTFIGLTGAPTPVGRKALPAAERRTVLHRLGMTSGDGYVPEKDLHAPGASTVVLRTADPTPMSHRNVVRYSGVINALQDVVERNGG